MTKINKRKKRKLAGKKTSPAKSEDIEFNDLNQDGTSEVNYLLMSDFWFECL